MISLSPSFPLFFFPLFSRGGRDLCMDTGRGENYIWDEGGSSKTRERSGLVEQGSEGPGPRAQVEGRP